MPQRTAYFITTETSLQFHFNNNNSGTQINGQVEFWQKPIPKITKCISMLLKIKP